METTFTLRWTREDKQADLNMGSFKSQAEAEQAIPAALGDLLGQCADEREKAGILAGAFAIEAEQDDETEATCILREKSGPAQ